MSFVFGEKSLKELNGVHHNLVKVVELALKKSRVDFAVHDGIRTVEEQRRYVDQGVSKTMNSKHLQGLAVDLVPYIDGKLRWWWTPIYDVAAAMHQAARELNVPIRWGVVWDRRLNDLALDINSPDSLPEALRLEGLAYNERHVGKDFPDGPHFELIK